LVKKCPWTDETMAESNANSTTDGKSVTLVGASVNVALIFFKLTAGILGTSQALIADAIHSVSDLFTDAVVFLGIRVGRKGPDEGHPFGHARLETLASSIVGLALILTALYLGIKSALDIYSNNQYHPKMLALIGAALSLGAKEALYHYTVRAGRRIKSQLVVANAWHHRSDAFSSIAVFLGVAGTLINPSWHILDSFAALIVSFLILKVGLEIVGKTLHEFIDAAPPAKILESIRHCTLGVEGVLEAHDLRVRTSGGLYQMEVHIVVDGDLKVIEGHNIAKEVENCLSREFDDFDRVIIHVDPLVKA
jgi:cation diffusion facilitator family transporter